MTCVAPYPKPPSILRASPTRRQRTDSRGSQARIWPLSGNVAPVIATLPAALNAVADEIYARWARGLVG